MIRNRTIIEVEVNGRIFCLQCAQESTWQEVIQAISLINDISNERIRMTNMPPKSSCEPTEALDVEQS